MEIIGKVKKIFKTQTFSSGFKKKEMVITTESTYPQDILIEFIQDKISLLDNLSKNDKIKVFINIRGREWKNSEGITKYFNSIQGWKIDDIVKSSSKTSSVSSDSDDDNNAISNSTSSSKNSTTTPLSDDDFDDLPF